MSSSLTDHPDSSGSNPDRPLVLIAVGESNLRDALYKQLDPVYEIRSPQQLPPIHESTTWQRPALLIMDARLSGTEQRRLSRALDHRAGIATILIASAAQARIHDEQEIAQAVDGILDLSFSEHALLAMTKSLLELAAYRQQAALQDKGRERVLDNFSDSFIAVDAQWRVTEVNTAAEQHVQVRRDDVLGKICWDAFSIEPDRAQAYRRAMEERVPVTLEGLSPKYGWYQLDAVPLDDGGLGVYFRNATPLKEAEAAAHASERRLRFFLEHAQDYALALLDSEERVTEWLGGAEAITGWSAAETVGNSLKLMFTPEDVAAGYAEKEFRQARETGRAWDMRWHQKKDGSRFFADGVTTAFRDDTGRLQGYGKIFRDATSQKVAEEALRESQERLQLIIESVADGVYVMASNTKCALLNPAGALMLGYQPEELVNRSIHNIIHHHRADGSPYPADECKIAKAVRDGVAVRVDDEVFWHKNGEPVPVEYSVNPMMSEGKIAGAVMVFTDITERKKSELALRESERRLRFAMDSMPQKIFTATQAGKVNYLNPAWEAFTGLSYEQIRSQGWKQLIHPDDLDNHREEWRRCVETGEPFQLEHRFRHADGQFRWHLTRARAMRNEHNQVLMWVGSNTDIHSVKAAEFELAQSLASERRTTSLLAEVAGASRAINAVLSVEEITQILTEHAQTILGVKQAVVSILKGEKLVHGVSMEPGDYRTYSSGARKSGMCAEVCRTNKVTRLSQETLERHPAWATFSEDCYGQPPVNGWLAVPLVGYGGKNIGLVQLSDKLQGEFTEDDEAILGQLAAIAAVGIENASLYASVREQDRRKDEFLATLAHELRNPLAPLQTGMNILQISANDEKTAKIHIMMERQLNHMVRLVADLMDVSRVSRGKIELKRARVSLQEVLEVALEATAPLTEAYRQSVVLSIPDDALHVDGDLTRLTQVVTNLLNNAAKYTPEGGTIEIAVGREDDQAEIRVSDTGAGLSPELLPRVFDLFTQAGPSFGESKGGLGIGLSLVQQLVRMHGGSVTAASPGLGRGSTFTIRLPLAPEHQHSSLLAEESSITPGLEKQRILIVDDNADAAETLAMLLELGGHHVGVVHEGAGALSAALELRPTVVFLDIGLPDMSGHEVAKAFRREPMYKDIVLIALTGWGTETDHSRSKQAGFDFHLTKPVDAQTISATLGRFFQGTDLP